MSDQLRMSPELQRALDKLQASRDSLRRQLIPVERTAGNAAEGARASMASWLRKLRRVARRWPVTAVATKMLQSWWLTQPWRQTGELLAGSLILQGRPLVRRHPIAAVAVAAALGGVLITLRPWRWALAEIKRLPMQTAWITLLMQMLLDSQMNPAPPTPDQEANQSPVAGGTGRTDGTDATESFGHEATGLDRQTENR